MEGKESEAGAGVTLAMLGGVGFGYLLAHNGDQFRGHWFVWAVSLLVATFGVYLVAKSTNP